MSEREREVCNERKIEMCHQRERERERVLQG
jgi:hypothetical protein